MLEKFHVPIQDTIRVEISELRKTVKSIFLKLGLNEEDSAQATDTLVNADERGVDTHGVSNMLRVYVEQFSSGFYNVNPKWKIKI